VKDDERQCPNCSREVLSWDIPCPGCEQVPWDTPAGRRALAGRRRSHFFRTQGPLLALVVFGVVLAAVGPVHLAQLISSRGEGEGLREAISHGVDLRRRWENTVPGSLEAEKLSQRILRWLDEELPWVLEAVQDPSHSLAERATAIVVLAKLFDGPESLGAVDPKAQEALIEALRQIARRGEDPVHAEAAMVLRVLAAPSERAVDGVSEEAYNQR